MNISFRGAKYKNFRVSSQRPGRLWLCGKINQIDGAISNGKQRGDLTTDSKKYIGTFSETK